MKIMILGGFGFIGSHLADSLIKNKHDLILVTKTLSKQKNVKHMKKNVKIEKIDITNFSKIEKCLEQHRPQVIIHLAGQTSHSKSFQDPIKDLKSNALSTLFLLEKIKNMKLKCRFILGSTFIVIGKPDKLPITESSPCNPTTIYAANRLASEHYCKVYHQVYGIDTVIFRITNSFGPREQIIPNKNAINYLIWQAHKGKEITIFEKGKFYRDLIYVDDVINGIKIIMKKGKPGNVYWISSGKKTWFYQLAKWINQKTNAKIKYVTSPSYTKKVDVGNFVVDNSKLRSLGWKPKISIQQGIEHTLEYFRSLNL